jgi:GNAT superfamily N-acetyltransferase
MRVVVRKGTAEDAPGLARLRWRWRVEERGERHGDREMFLDFFTAWVLDHLATHVPFVVEVDDRMAGMAWLMLSDRVPSPVHMDRRTGDLQPVYVLPELRGHGVGTALLNAIVADARIRELEHLTVHSGEQAVPYYQRVGFAGDGRWLQHGLA